MKHSIFWKLLLYIMPFIFIVDAALLVVTFQVTYNHNMEHRYEDVKGAACAAAEFYTLYDPDDAKMSAQNTEVYDDLCNYLDMTYIYALKPDKDSNTMTYLSIGYSDMVNENTRKLRYAGYVVNGIYEEERAVCDGEEFVFSRGYSEEFGNTIACYTSAVYFPPEGGEGKFTIIGAEMSVEETLQKFRETFIGNVIFILATTILLCITIFIVFRNIVSVPANKISRRMTEFVSDRKNEFVPIEIRGHDELAEMSRSFNSMALEIDNYISDISELNRQKHMQQAELDIARQIQLGLLEPPSFRTGCVSINAGMLPAKDVAGDLYDYQELEDGKISVVIADVSGKGVSAALFMSRAITLLRQYAAAGQSPGEILSGYNNSLVKNNPNLMFITTFVGVYDPAAGTLTYANAGHNPPYLLSDGLVKLEEPHGAAAGVFEGMEYEDRVIELKAGDMLFLYTDGVPEAGSSDKVFFGEQRLERLLTDMRGSDGKTMIKAVFDEVKTFCTGADQSDDITMLTLQILPDSDDDRSENA